MQSAPMWASRDRGSRARRISGILCCEGNEEVGGEGHGLPRDHEGVGIVGEDDEGHAGEEDVILQAHEAGGRAFGRRGSIRRRRWRCPRRRGQDQEEEGGERVETQVEGQVGKTERKDEGLGCGVMEEEDCGGNGDGETDHGAEGKKEARDRAAAARGEQAGEADEVPRGGAQQHELERMREESGKRRSIAGSGFRVHLPSRSMAS